jgi:hypothetical protein
MKWKLYQVKVRKGSGMCFFGKWGNIVRERDRISKINKQSRKKCDIFSFSIRTHTQQIENECRSYGISCYCLFKGSKIVIDIWFYMK